MVRFQRVAALACGMALLAAPATAATAPGAAPVVAAPTAGAQGAAPAANDARLQVGEETVFRHLTGRSFHPDDPKGNSKPGRAGSPRVALSLALNNCLLSGAALGGTTARDLLDSSQTGTLRPDEVYRCVQRVGVAAIVSYKSIAGDREAAANLDAIVTTTGFGGAILGQSHWSKADTLEWWKGAGTVGLIYDELSGTKSRALIYASGAQAARIAIFRSVQLDTAAAGLDEMTAPYTWTANIRNADGELAATPLAKTDFSSRYLVACGLPSAPNGFTDGPAKVAAEVFRRDASARCAELIKTYSKLRAARRKLCPPGADACKAQSAVWLANDLNQIDELISNGDRAVRARSTDVFGVVVRSAANVVANLAVKLNGADTAPIAYVPRALAGAGDPLELSGFPSFTPPVAIDGALSAPPELGASGATKEAEKRYLVALQTRIAALNEMTEWLDDRVADAELIQAISRRNKLRFDLTNAIRPVNLLAPS